MHRPVVLVILDGWGLGPDYPGNAVLAADTPTMDRLWEEYPKTTLRCSGRDVGLPEGQMGNSEVGHLNIGAGFIVYQWITRIDAAIEDRSFFETDAFLRAADHVRANSSALHLMGLIGDGGVHAYQEHLYALIRFASHQGIERVFIHAFMDGRDTPPTSGLDFMRELLRCTEQERKGQVASISGRYFAMDRDRRWERTRQAYDAIVLGIGETTRSPIEAIEASYARGVTDEFIVPTVVVDESGQPVGTISDGDAVIYFNFRSDRARQLTQALVEVDFTGFPRPGHPQNVLMATMTEYEPELPVLVAFPPQNVDNPLARVIASAGLTQFHTAETEKYAHVTYFLNGGREEPFPGEERLMAQSPRVATYDLQPEMSALPLTDGMVDAIDSGKFSFLVINYANGDMVGHTGVFRAAVKAIETVDTCLARVIDATLKHDGVLLVTADHGNADEMLIPGTEQVWTAHTKNPVPCILVSPVGSPLRGCTLRAGGRLADIAPTILEILGIAKPAVMTGQSLIVHPEP